MEEIEFRGKRIDNNEWIYGWLRQSGHQNITKRNGQYVRTEKYYQIQDEKYNSQFVDEKTIGQYTGQKDKNGNKIFRGDIVYVIPEDEKGVVKWDNETARYIVLVDNTVYDFDYLYGHDLEIIGNVYDNPELLEE